MSNIVPLNTGAVREFSKQDLQLIKRTVAADTNDDEFRLFVDYCRALQLDPRRKQIYCLVYNRDKPDKRKMSIIVGIDGFRSIAARTGNYRPDDEEPKYEINSELVGPTNPAGLVKASVKVWQFSHGSWFPVTGSAYWNEFVPLESEWAWDEAAGKKKPTGKKKPGGKWSDMPHLMLAKVAEAQALRKAWPDNFTGVYAPEEMDQANVEILDPVDAVNQAEVEDRMARIGGHGIIVDWLDNKPLVSVPVGQFGDRVMDFIEKHKDEPSQLLQWKDRNTVALREFWAHNSGDCHILKETIDKLVKGAGEEESK
jgi:phage recombination protein Bet